MEYQLQVTTDMPYLKCLFDILENFISKIQLEFSNDKIKIIHRTADKSILVDIELYQYNYS